MRKAIYFILAFVLGLMALVAPARAALADTGGSACVTAGSSTLSDCANTGPGVYGIEARALAATMAAHPAPDITPLTVDDRLLGQHAYRKVLQATDIYSAPGGGSVVGHIDTGFNFVDAGREVNNWIEIRPNEWLPDKMLGPVNKAVSHFAGVLLPNGVPDIPFGWVLLDTRPSRLPGVKASKDIPEVKRYTLVNFFAVEKVGDWEWYLIGPDQWIEQRRVARLQPVKRPDGVSGKWFAVDLYEQTMTAYQDDKAIFVTLISSGLPLWPTSEGLTKIWDRYASTKMSGGGPNGGLAGNPDFYFLPEVPYIQYFNTNEQALHGTYWHDGFGYRHSHGCVNLSMTDAKWAFDWTADQKDAYVYVYHSGVYKEGATR
ncbi:MAG TPA: L,D-transpeptidase [Aggregatilineales bacterium]|nr:L,D-transpeptidase [Aggregatilineales bacterium]